jgi:transcriptional regulator of arginine metabolism
MYGMTNKVSRHFLIREIIAHKNITSQEDLAAELTKQGMDVTQATLSRDLQELNVARVHSMNGSRYLLPRDTEEPRIKTLVGYEIINIDANETNVIIRTLPGRAGGVASYLDSLRNPDILGTIAGDDTIMVIPSTTKKTHTILKHIKSLITEKSK